VYVIRRNDWSSFLQLFRLKYIFFSDIQRKNFGNTYVYVKT